MEDTVWFQIIALFYGILHHSVLFLVFTVFTSIMNFFLLIPFKPPSRGTGGYNVSYTEILHNILKKDTVYLKDNPNGLILFGSGMSSRCHKRLDQKSQYSKYQPKQLTQLSVISEKRFETMGMSISLSVYLSKLSRRSLSLLRQTDGA